MRDCAVFFLVSFGFVCIAIVLRHCQRWRINHRSNNTNNGHGQIQLITSRILQASAGVDTNLINSLPLIEFMSLNCSSLGSECAVCLARFEDRELLHLLPKCKHVFHIQCIGKWLESHSSCPICRRNVDAEDFSSFTWLNGPWNSGSMTEPSTQRASESSVHQSDDKVQGSLRTNSGLSDSSACAICHHRFDDAELLLVLPKCKHVFHVGCICSWLESHSTCPICRQIVDTQDLSSSAFILYESLNTSSSTAESIQRTDGNSIHTDNCSTSSYEEVSVN